MKANYYSSNHDRMQKQIEQMVDKQIAEAALREEGDVMALVLYILNSKFGWGEVRLKRFQEAFHDGLLDLTAWYEMDNKDGVFLARRKMNQLGIDVDIFAKENLT